MESSSLQNIEWLHEFLTTNTQNLQSVASNLNDWYKLFDILKKNPETANPPPKSNLFKTLLDIPTLSLFARSLRDTHKYSQALALYEKIHQIQITTTKTSPSNLNPLETLFQMAVCFNELTDYGKAYAIFKSVFDQRKAVLGPIHEDTIVAQLFLAMNLNFQEKFTEALQLFEEIHETRKFKPELNIVDTLYVHGMGLCLVQLKEHMKAQKFFTNIFEKRELILGLNHEDTIKAESSIAHALANQGKFKDALTLYEHVCLKLTFALGAHHAEALAIRNEMVFCLNEQKKFESALELCKQLYDTLVKTRGPNHRETLSVQMNTALILKNQGKSTEALKLYEQIRHKQLSTVGPDHAETLNTMCQMGDCLSRLKRFNKAVEIYTAVFENRNRILGPQHRDTSKVKEEISKALASQEKCMKSLMKTHTAPRRSKSEPQLHKINNSVSNLARNKTAEDKCILM